ncbi:MAG: TIGR01906 family membrane protein, partial [Clostridiaceae bacterium]|nr:TIGR01906 family membrane protein [Clostridiaceae bacterium]
MKKINVIFVALFVVLVPIMLLLTDVQLVAYNRDYYRAEYSKYGIPEHIAMSMDNLMDSTEKLMLYLENKRDDLDFEASFNKGKEEFFSQRDKQHMVDVKGLFVKGRFIRDFSFFYILIIILLLFWKKPFMGQLRKLARYGIAIAAAGIVPVIILVILMNIDFYKYFTVFHKIFFTNDLWLLDPATDRLINIFPQDFFTDMAFSISYLYIAEMAAILVGSLLILRFVKAK